MVQPSKTDFATFWASFLEPSRKNNDTEQDHLYQCLHRELRKKSDFGNFGSWNLNHLRCWCLESPKVNLTLWGHKGIFLKKAVWNKST